MESYSKGCNYYYSWSNKNQHNRHASALALYGKVEVMSILKTNTLKSVDGTVTVDIKEITTSAQITKIVKLTQAEYDALNPKVSTTMYLIT